MQMEEKAVGDVTVLTVTGEITLSGGADAQLRERVSHLLSAGSRKVVLDLGGVTYTDSSGLGQLVQMTTIAKASGGVLKVANPARRLQQLLTAAKVTSLFDIHETAAAAVASINPGAP